MIFTSTFLPLISYALTSGGLSVKEKLVLFVLYHIKHAKIKRDLESLFLSHGCDKLPPFLKV